VKQVSSLLSSILQEAGPEKNVIKSYDFPDYTLTVLIRVGIISARSVTRTLACMLVIYNSNNPYEESG
jgi:hypothetical protein